MCGFFSYLGDTLRKTDLIESGEKISYRGPDNSSYFIFKPHIFFGFHRLSIVDTSSAGNQPMFHPEDKNIALICNGEIYNHEDIKKVHNITTNSGSDCEVILHLYKKYGIEKTLSELDGVFAFCLYDQNTGVLYSARDPYGVRPSFFGETHNGEIFIASEAKAMSNYCNEVKQFPPGTWWSSESNAFNKYYNSNHTIDTSITEKSALVSIKKNLIQAVEKRMMSEREIGCLLSGGLDSSLIASIVSRLSSEKIKTFSIGLEGSPDLHYAKIVADWIGSDHHEIIMTTSEFLNAIEDVIYKIESYDTTTVRASVGNYLVSKYISENTNCKVIFNGDGSDEVCCGYVYNKNAPDALALQAESQKLIDEIHFFDVLRSDRSISSNGLEARTPFLDKEFVKHYMSIPPELKAFDKTTRVEKHLLRKAFAPAKGDEENAFLPDEILWRHKCAFSDGVSSAKNSWHKSIQEFVNSKITDEEFEKGAEALTHCKPMLKESLYYRNIFKTFYPNLDKIIPHFWMPNWTDVIDPSARELSGYTE
tara:strand:+ start:8526 stop:10130 length:1605 start_codon:yes stop_codon:yes gene_type:complete